MNIRDLRTQLETTLVDVLGEYTLANGVKTPAISVRAIGESLPAGQRVRGLECVIVREPQLEPVRQYRREQAISRWTVYLVDWAGDTSLLEIAEQLVYAYPGSRCATVNVPKRVGPRSQMRLELQTDPEALVAC